MDLYFKTALVFTHFALAAFCIVTIIGTDLKLLRQYGTPASAALCAEIEQVKRAVSRGLLGLWITGLVIVAHGVLTSPGYLDNQKLWFKIVVVIALTLNGLLVHRIGKALQPGVTLAKLDDGIALQLNLAGTTSSISWLWACLLGTARAWNGTLSFQTILLYYVATLLAGLGIALGLHRRHRQAALAMPADAGADEPAQSRDDALAVHHGAITGKTVAR